MLERDMFKSLKDFLKMEKKCNVVAAEVTSCDVVGVSSKGAIAVEMKKSLNFKVIEQAFSLLGRAEHIYICVPEPKNKDAHRFVKNYILRDYGVGLLYFVKDDYLNLDYVYEALESIDHGVVGKPIKESIDDASLLAVGGSKSGDTITSYKLTIERIKEFMKNGGQEYYSAVSIANNVKTHWKNPTASIRSELRMPYNSEWIKVKREGRAVVFGLRNT